MPVGYSAALATNPDAICPRRVLLRTGISLVAETTTGCMMTSDVTSQPQGSEGPPSVPEQLGTSAAHLLLDEIYR